MMDPQVNSLAKRFLDATVNQRWGLDKEVVLDVLNEVYLANDNFNNTETYHRFKDEFKQAIYNRLDLTTHKDLLVKGKDSIINAILLDKADVRFFKTAGYVLEKGALMNSFKEKERGIFSQFLGVVNFAGLDHLLYDYDALMKE